MAAEAQNPAQIIEVAEIAWESITPTIKAKMLWSDPATKRRAQITRFEPGASLSMHRHVGDELLYVIEGSISDESGRVSAGSVGYRPNGCVHTVTSKNGATVLRDCHRRSRAGERDQHRATLTDDRAERHSLDRVDAWRAAEGLLERSRHEAARGDGALGARRKAATAQALVTSCSL